MSNDDYVVGRAYGEMAPNQSSIYEALLERAERERDEAREALSEWEDAAKHVEANHPDEVHCGCVPVLRKLLTDAQKENEEQARLLGKGSEREARLITERDNMQDQRDLAMRMAKEREKERDHYKAGLEEISKTIDDWLNSLVQEPSLDFIHAIKTWADKKLKEI